MLSIIVLEMSYMDDNDKITKRRVKVFKADKDLFVTNCFFYVDHMYFKLDNILAVVHIVNKQWMVV